jgi:predicted nucleic acid-binding protein
LTITAADSSVLLDVLTDDPRFGSASYEALEAARRRGKVVVCPAVWAEIRAFFEHSSPMREALSEAGIFFDPFDEESAALAGATWRSYRRAGGKRERLLADFLIAAHAQVRTDCLLTRDRGFARRYFEQLAVLQPR